MNECSMLHKAHKLGFYHTQKHVFYTPNIVIKMINTTKLFVGNDICPPFTNYYSYSMCRMLLNFE
jgi:hypothetical protein